MKQQFYLTLVSGLEHDSFPNRIGNYMNRLSPALHFTEQYEVGVSSVCYSNSFYSVQRSEDYFFFIAELKQKHKQTVPTRYDLSTVFYGDASYPLHRGNLSEGHYTSAADFVAKLNYAVPRSAQAHVSFVLDAPRGFLSVKITSPYLVILPKDSKISELLGFTETFLFTNKEAKHPLILSNLSHFYVSCDCIAPVLHGDKRLKLLCSVPIGTTPRNHTREYCFNPIQYHLLTKEIIDNIHVEILNADLAPLIFETGSCFVKLHFRKKHERL